MGFNFKTNVMLRIELDDPSDILKDGDAPYTVEFLIIMGEKSSSAKLSKKFSNNCFDFAYSVIG